MQPLSRTCKPERKEPESWHNHVIDFQASARNWHVVTSHSSLEQFTWPSLLPVGVEACSAHREAQ